MATASPPVVSTTRVAAHPTGRLLGLDALRGIAALGVTVFHLTSQYGKDYGFTQKPLITFPYGSHGVTLFFVISGFVIFMTLERTKRPIDFAVSRFSRLYPTYWAAVLLSTLALSLFPLPDTAPGLSQRLAKACVNLTMFQRWFRVKSIDAVYWTLEIELCFYLMMFVLLWRKALDKAIPTFAALTCIAIVDQYFFAQYASGLPKLLRGLFILNYINAFLAGMCVYRYTKTKNAAYWLIVPLCLAVPAMTGSTSQRMLHTALLASFVLAVFVAAKGWLKVLENPVLRFLGTISYSLYLIHNTIGCIIIDRLTHSGVNTNVAVIVAIASAIGLATVMTFTIERPVMARIREAKKRSLERGTTLTAPVQTVAVSV